MIYEIRQGILAVLVVIVFVLGVVTSMVLFINTDEMKRQDDTIQNLTIERNFYKSAEAAADVRAFNAEMRQ